jgi:hypothetical protein
MIKSNKQQDTVIGIMEDCDARVSAFKYVEDR